MLSIIVSSPLQTGTYLYSLYIGKYFGFSTEFITVAEVYKVCLWRTLSKNSDDIFLRRCYMGKEIEFDRLFAGFDSFFALFPSEQLIGLFGFFRRPLPH